MTTNSPATRKAPVFSYKNKRDLITLANMIFPLVFVGSIGLYFHEFVWHAIAVNLSINLGIICMASFGAVLILMRLFSAQKDFRIIERFGYEANQGVYMKTLLEQPWLSHRYVRHYLSHIANTGGTLSTQLEHSAIESELHALQTDYESRMELPQFIVGFMIAMGLLGTFIGLLETLTGIAGMLDHMSGGGEDVQKQFMQLVAELRKPLAGMGIAFSASMFGLITSLMLAIMMIHLRRFVSRVISLARNIMHELTQMAREQSGVTGASLSPSDIDALLGQSEQNTRTTPYPQALPPIFPDDELQEGVRNNPMFRTGGTSGGLDPAIAGRFDLMTKKIEMLIETISNTNEASRRLNDLMGFGPRMKEISERTLEETKNLSSQNGEQQGLLKGLIDQIARLSELTVDTSRHQVGIGEKTLEETKNLWAQNKEQQQFQQQLLQALIDQVARSSESAIDSSRHQFSLGERTLEEIKNFSAQNTLQQRLLQGVTDQIARSSEIAIDNGRHMFSIKENFTKFGKSSDVIELIAANIGGQTALLETLVEEIRRSQQGLAIINKTIMEK